jgi:hypothetical protein
MKQQRASSTNTPSFSGFEMKFTLIYTYTIVLMELMRALLKHSKPPTPGSRVAAPSFGQESLF